jgi:uncharacterized protein (TIGR02246 family)
MKMRLLWLLTVPALAVSSAAWPWQAGQPKGSGKDETAIEKNAEAFVEAFHKGDSKALAAFWTADGEYTQLTGRLVKGREAIEMLYKEMFSENKGLKVRIESQSLRFVGPEVAIEEGTSEVFPPDGAPPSRANYTIVHVKREGKWLLSSVRDTPFTPPSNYEHLRGLQGAIGEWASEAGKGEVERLSFAWSENQNFIEGSMSTTFNNVAIASAKVQIGWDPTAKRVRSWMFDADGGFGEGSWTREGKKWLITTSSVLPDGTKAAATFAVTFVDADTIALRITDRSVAGKALPETKEIQLKRVK